MGKYLEVFLSTENFLSLKCFPLRNKEGKLYKSFVRRNISHGTVFTYPDFASLQGCLEAC